MESSDVALLASPEGRGLLAALPPYDERAALSNGERLRRADLATSPPPIRPVGQYLHEPGGVDALHGSLRLDRSAPDQRTVVLTRIGADPIVVVCRAKERGP